MTDIETLLGEMKEMRAQLEKAASRPANSGPPASVLFGGNSPYQQHRADEWPVERLKALGEAYGSQAAVDMYCRKRSDGKPRFTGMGPALVKLAAMSGNKDAIAMATSQGLFNENYGIEQLRKEFGFIPATEGRVVKTPNGEIRKAALAEGSGQTGGYTVPPQFMNELLTIAAEDAFIEPRAKVLPMNSRTAQWPMLDITTAQAAGTSPYSGGILATWQPEATTISETEPAFRQSEWTAWDLVLYTVSSNQLLADNGIGLDALLTQLFGQAITWYKEFAFLQGKGAGSTMPLGVLNAPATYVQNRTNTGTAKFVYADVAAMMSHLQIRSWDDACWIMHQSVVPQLMQMSDFGSSNNAQGGAGSHLVWLSPYGNGSSVGPKGDVMLIDWSRYVIGMRMEMQIDVSPHYLFRNNQLAWRVIARCDGKPWLNNTITDQAGWVISPMVVLN